MIPQKTNNIMEETKKTWGGAREGAGRKAKEHSFLSIRVTPDTAQWIKEYSKSSGISQGAVVDLLVEKMKGSDLLRQAAENL